MDGQSSSWVVGLVALLRFRVDTLGLVLGGAFLGLVRYLLLNSVELAQPMLVAAHCLKSK